MNIKQVIEKLETQKKEHSAAIEEIEKIQEGQVEYLSSLISEYEPIYRWYHDNHFIFTHPTINIKSPVGPIMGQGDDYVIVFNIGKKRPEKVDIHDTDDRKFYPLSKLIKDGHFKEAQIGIQHLEYMLGKYVDHKTKHANKLRDQLKGKDLYNQKDSDFGLPL